MYSVIENTATSGHRSPWTDETAAAAVPRDQYMTMHLVGSTIERREQQQSTGIRVH